MKRQLTGIIVAAIMGLSLCACGTDEVVDDVVDQATNVVQSTNENVVGVKEGTNSLYPGVKYGEAFENYFGAPTWKYFKGTKEGPDDDGDGKPDYTVDDIDVVEFTGTCTYDNVKVKALIQFTLDKEDGTFEENYLSFNEVPQSTLMLESLIEKVFTQYMEEHGMAQKDVETEDSSQSASVDEAESYEAESLSQEDSQSSSAESTYSGDYGYEALDFAGYYEGFAYSIAFSAYTEVDSDEIGVVEIYSEGELIATKPVYICSDRGDWSGWDYEQFYEIRCDGYNEYLGFYASGDAIALDYNGPTKNYDMLEMKEHYES